MSSRQNPPRTSIYGCLIGWSKIVDGSALACFKAIQNLQKRELKKVGEVDKLRLNFNQFLSLFLKEICGTDCFRHLPPMLGNGQSMDLLRLYLVVRNYGGYETVSKNKLWSSVAKECGLDSSVGSAVKLIYVKYLDSLDRWLQKKAEDNKLDSVAPGGISMDLKSDLKCGWWEMSNEKVKEGENPQLDLSKAELCSMSVEKLCKLNEVGVFPDNADDERGLFRDGTGNSTMGRDEIKGDGVCKQTLVFNDAKDELISANGVEWDGKGIVVDDIKLSVCLSPDVLKEDDNSRKRKRKCYSGFLNWVKQVAKEPCDLSIGYLPERSKWKYYGSEHLWKQGLLLRQSMFVRVNADSNIEQSIWQVKQRMHPAMYDDYSGSERLRCSQRILSAKESELVSSKKLKKASDGSESSSSAVQCDLDNQSDPSTADSVASLWVNNYSRKRIPLGPPFQAQLPEWSGETYQSDSKWLGTQIWPLEKGLQNKLLIERDRIGKGRQDSCGCQFPDSVECVRFHVAEKRVKVKLELSSAFFHWRLNEMGEEVALSWTKEEEKNFLAIVKSNPLSQDKCFWNELYKLFPRKRRQDLLSYYFNVFLLQRRAYQNRYLPTSIDSDDDESEFGSAAKGFGREAVVSPGSIFCSPKKAHLNLR